MASEFLKDSNISQQVLGRDWISVGNFFIDRQLTR